MPALPNRQGWQGSLNRETINGTTEHTEITGESVLSEAQP